MALYLKFKLDGEARVFFGKMFWELEGYPRTPDSSEGLIPRATICYIGIDPYVLFF